MTAEESFYVTDTPTHFTYAAYLVGEERQQQKIDRQKF